MEDNINYLRLFREKKNEIHTHEEIKEAFEDSFVMCFDFNEKRTITSRSKLFTGIWEINPDAIITECDLCVMSAEPKAYRKQFLVINKNGAKEMSNSIYKLIEESGVVSSAYCFFSEKKAGLKRCYRTIFDEVKHSLVYKANLIIDGSDLLLSIRHQSQADHKARKSEALEK